MTTRRTNWIDGEPRPAERGAWFDLPAADGRTPLARWPRSGEEDLALALDAARRAERAWIRLGRAERRGLLARAAATLLDAPDPDGLAGGALGFSADELARHLRGLDAALDDALRSTSTLARGPLGAREGPCVLVPSWSATWHAPARSAFFALCAGRPVVLAPDGRSPAPLEALGAAARELPRGVLAVLHDDGRTLARALVASAREATVVVADDRLDESVGSAPHVVVDRAARATVVIDPREDLLESVERVLDRAIGRPDALSGSRAGHVGRIVAPERVFSRVAGLVLERLERSSDAARPLPLAHRVQAERLTASLALGLDEGATAILAGLGAGGPPFPLLFTNVESGMRIARERAPCGVLHLIRARDLAAAHSLAARFDRELPS